MNDATIKLGTRTLTVPSDVARLAGFEVYSDGSTRELSFSSEPLRRLARALDELPEGTSDERVVLRSIANYDRRLEAERVLAEQRKAAEVGATAAKNERAAAGMKVWIERQSERRPS